MTYVAEPTWASDAALDEVFVNWVPGQLDELIEVLAQPDPEPLGVWTRAHDDILPTKRRKLRFRRRTKGSSAS